MALARPSLIVRNLISKYNGDDTAQVSRTASQTNQKTLTNMIDPEVQSELFALRTLVEQSAANALGREKEWRRLARISSCCAILSALVGAGFIIANAAIEKTSTNLVFHDQLVMMGITLMVLNIPLMLLGSALRSGSKQKP